MVYAKYLRTGVYFLQDAFRYLDLEPDKYGIQIAKKLIELSPANHFARNYIDTENFGFETKDLTFEAGFVDTFFNARDIAYDIPELRSLIENSGAYFQNWLDNSFYYRPLFNFPTNSKVDRRYSSLEPWDLADFTQKMSPNSGKFAFSLRKKKEFEHRFFNRVEISPDTFAHKYLLKDIEKPELRSGSGGSIGYGNFCVELTVKDRILWDSLNRTVSEIIDFSNSIADEFDLTENFTMDYVIAKLHNFWKSGYLNFSDEK